MPGLDPGIHDLSRGKVKNVDGRDKPGHDEVRRETRTNERSSSEAVAQTNKRSSRPEAGSAD